MAASINISSVSFSVSGKDSIYTTSVNTSYSCTANWQNKLTDDNEPDASSGTHTWYTYSYSDLSYAWAFTPAQATNPTTSSGTKTLEGLTSGTATIIKATVTVTGVETTITHSRTDEVDTPGYYYYSPPLPEQGDMTDDEYTEAVTQWAANGGTVTWIPPTYKKGTASTSSSTSNISATASSEEITIYTRPGIFTDYNFSQNVIIQSSEGLTATKVSNWITHCNNFAHWYNQNNIDTAGIECEVSSNDIITATWYNACVDACADSTMKPSYVTGGLNGTIITPQIFANLGAAISKDDT